MVSISSVTSSGALGTRSRLPSTTYSPSSRVLAVQAEGHQFDVLAVQLDFALGTGRIAAHRHPVGDDGAGGIEVEAEFNGIDQVAGGGVILPVDGLGRIGAHGLGSAKPMVE
jgi:hypothetical protein